MDRTLLYLNLVLLLFVVLIPFSTATAAEYLTKNDWDARVAMVVYAGVFVGMSAGFGAIFEWTLHGDRVYQPVPPERRWARAVPVRRRRPASTLAAVVLALFNAYAAFVLTGLIGVYYIAERTPAAPAAARTSRRRRQPG